MIIRRYGPYPAMYLPDTGEVVQARLSPSDPWARAVVVMIRKRQRREFRLELMWLETQEHTTVRTGEYSHVQLVPDGRALVRQLPPGTRSAVDPPGR